MGDEEEDVVITIIITRDGWMDPRWQAMTVMEFSAALQKTLIYLSGKREIEEMTNEGQ